MVVSSVLSLPRDLLILIPDYLHNIEDYTNLSSTCSALRECTNHVSPNTILRLAAAQSSTFFRPSPHFLVTATARELGHWARSSEANEAELAKRLEEGVEGLLDLGLQHCGLTMERIRELHLARFSVINPVTNIIDQCVGDQWYANPNFWDGGVDDAYTITADPPTTLFHLALYGELFGPDFASFLDPDGAQAVRRLSVKTRLEFIKYCVPDDACNVCADSASDVRLPDGTIDPRRAVKDTGPYSTGEVLPWFQNNIALVWVLRSSRFRPHWRAMRARAGIEDFQSDFDDGWWYAPDPEAKQDWRQRMLEGVMICQGLEGLGMVRPVLQDQWIEKVRAWKRKISELDEEPQWIHIGRQTTLEYPFLLGDLRICGSGYVLGT